MHRRDRLKSSKFGRMLIDQNFKLEKTNYINLEIIECYASVSEIEGITISYLVIGNHLRNIYEESDYIDTGQSIYMRLPEDNKPHINENEEKIYFDLAFNKYEQICNKLSTELAALPNYEGICYRYCEGNDIQAYANNIKVNDFVMDNSFISSSIYKGAGGWNKWGFEGTESFRVGFFIIKSKTGKYIGEISAATNEKEILFDKRSIFEVLEIINISNNTFYIYLEETSKDRQIQQVKNIFTGEAMV